MLPRQTGRGLSRHVVTFMILSRIGKNSAGVLAGTLVYPPGLCGFAASC